MKTHPKTRHDEVLSLKSWEEMLQSTVSTSSRKLVLIFRQSTNRGNSNFPAHACLLLNNLTVIQHYAVWWVWQFLKETMLSDGSGNMLGIFWQTCRILQQFNNSSSSQTPKETIARSLDVTPFDSRRGISL